MRVVVHLGAVEDQLVLLLQLLLDVLVCRLDVLPLEVWHLVCEAATVVNRMHHAGTILQDDAPGQAHAVIVLAEGRRLVDDAGPRLSGHIVVRQDLPRRGLRLALEVVEEGLVADPLELGALLLPEQLKVLLRVLLHRGADPGPSVLAHDPLGATSFALHLQIREVRVHAEREVRGQSPGSRRPRQHVGILLRCELELDDDRGI
mmetsp:Transcript_96445/g.229668  ORF Transcript_96445/g.229668 Transcript_96445/m.229668 type:complete len:204 (-) Transcript_96445:753-1364(-)